jgi:hypothetical protein
VAYDRLKPTYIKDGTQAVGWKGTLCVPMLHLILSTPLMVLNKSAIRAVISIYVFNLLGVIKLANHPVVLFYKYDPWIRDNSCDHTGDISVADHCRVSLEP